MSESNPSSNEPTGPRAGYNDRAEPAIASSKEENAFPKGRLIAALIIAVLLTATLITAAVVSLKKSDETTKDGASFQQTAHSDSRAALTQLRDLSSSIVA